MSDQETDDLQTILDQELNKKFHQKTDSNHQGIAALRKLIAGNEEYPPSEDLWRQILYHLKKRSDQKKFRQIKQQLQQEVEQYRPALPEPILIRFYHLGEYYFLDGKNQIYQTDPGNPMVGNLVGQINPPDLPNQPNYQVVINQKVVHTLPEHKVKERKIHNRTYYVNSNDHVFRGLHPQHPYIYSMGKLNQEGKIELDP